MGEVSVDLAQHRYTIHINAGGINRAGSLMNALPLGKKALIVTDENVGPLYAGTLADNLVAAGYQPEVLTVAAGEASKSMDTANIVFTQAIRMGLDRKSAIIALGGGVVGDLAGFTAATYLRGVPFIQVPTTLLAQVDSSVGGKTAVNHSLGKNLIGCFYQPSLVVIDPEVLNTLPERELKAGLAEVVKYGVIADRNFFAYLAANAEALLKRSPAILANVIETCCQLKAQVVAEDERETSLRMILNLGHTIGHAVEAAGGYSEYSHGEAVAIGMHAAAIVSRKLDMCAPEDMEGLKTLLGRLGLPLKAPGYQPEELMRYLARDKKVVSGEVSWILMTSIGQVKIIRGVPGEAVMAALAEIT
ncbi:3-dehydroquinate synthase [Sporomusa aerivorans]|uniref:3-dehydroquinate synthase n=1 Tax=Sporomusa aerivorans TaxID=204936 RepID=UPI00352B3EB3